GALRDVAGNLGGQWLADRDPADRPARPRCAADGGRPLCRARAGRGRMSRLGSRGAAALVLILAATLAGCSALDPYPAAPRAAQAGAPAGPRVAICYNTLTTPLAAVQAEAQQECSANTVARPVDTDWYQIGRAHV